MFDVDGQATSCLPQITSVHWGPMFDVDVLRAGIVVSVRGGGKETLRPAPAPRAEGGEKAEDVGVLTV